MASGAEGARATARPSSPRAERHKVVAPGHRALPDRPALGETPRECSVLYRCARPRARRVCATRASRAAPRRSRVSRHRRYSRSSCAVNRAAADFRSRLFASAGATRPARSAFPPRLQPEAAPAACAAAAQHFAPAGAATAHEKTMAPRAPRLRGLVGPLRRHWPIRKRAVLERARKRVVNSSVDNTSPRR
jgi:hypothetical protein